MMDPSFYPDAFIQKPGGFNPKHAGGTDTGIKFYPPTRLDGVVEA